MSGGNAIVRDNATLRPGWIARGAHTAAVVSPVWSKNGSQISTNINVASALLLPASTPVTLALRYQDPWGRSKQGTLQVEVSNPKHTAIVMSAVTVVL
jgi:hypothetical protein